MTIRPLMLAAAGAAAALSLTAPAFAEAVRVEYQDLNLSTSEGRQVLERRLDAAARQVCGIGGPQTGTRIPSRDAARCYKQARQDLGTQFASVVEKTARGG